MCRNNLVPPFFRSAHGNLFCQVRLLLTLFALFRISLPQIKDEKLLADVLNLAVEIAQRSAKHSAEFLEHTPAVADALVSFGQEKLMSPVRFSRSLRNLQTGRAV